VILAIDPGPTQSAWCYWEGENLPLRFGLAPNEDVLLMLRLAPQTDTPDRWVLVIEQMCSYGMRVGREVFDTVYWSGRFHQAWGGEVRLIPRLAVKLHICHDSRAKDANIRRALLDRFGPAGTKKAPGFLYGVKRDVWSALALAVTAYETPETE